MVYTVSAMHVMAEVFMKQLLTLLSCLQTLLCTLHCTIPSLTTPHKI
jgi:hypothetical protein